MCFKLDPGIDTTLALGEPLKCIVTVTNLPIIVQTRDGRARSPSAPRTVRRPVPTKIAVYTIMGRLVRRNSYGDASFIFLKRG